MPKQAEDGAEDLWPTSGAVRGAPVSGALDSVALEGTPYVVPRIFDAYFADPRLPFDLEVSVTMTSSGPHCSHLDVEQRPDGDEVTAKRLASIPLALLMQQAARFMAMIPSVGKDGSVTLTPARLTPEGRAEVAAAWRLARAADRRRAFPPTRENLRLVGRLVDQTLKAADPSRQRPTVFASVKSALEREGVFVSRATVQRRIKQAQEEGFAPEWVKGKP